MMTRGLRGTVLSLLLLVTAVGCIASGGTDEPIVPYDALAEVDPFIGTGGLGGEVVGLNPGAALPFGMTQVGPDTSHSEFGALPFYHFGGYHYSDDLILGFSHEHANGMGTNDFGTVLVMPRASWRDALAQPDARAAPFIHEDEEAGPGRYSVRLADDGTEVAIAATLHGGVHRYVFSETEAPVVLVDLGHRLGTVEVSESSVSFDLSSGRTDAFQLLQGAYSRRFGGLQTWAHLSVSPLPVSGGVWTESMSPAVGTHQAQGERVGLWMVLPEGTTEAEVRVALSHTDAEGARGNHAAELEGRSFDAILESAESAWDEQLGRVRVRGGTAEQRVIFHTAHYHAALWPNVFSDQDGRYRGLDGTIHEADFPYHSNFSMWDTFRTTHPWFTLAQPDKARSFARSLVRMAEDGGAMPRWALGHGYTGGMVGTPAAQILAGTWLKGVDGWDAEAAFDMCLRHSTGPMPEAGRAGITSYRDKGYVPMEEEGGSTSLGIEYAWNDHALALWADSLGRSNDAAQMAEAAGWWRNNWDPEQGFMVGRYADGSFHSVGDPDVWNAEYVEGNSWHYRWPAPYDAVGMVDLQYGGDVDAFGADLSLYWTRVAEEEDDVFPDTYYWHGNEPDLHHPWLGSLLGLPEHSLSAVRHVMSTRYDTSPSGLDGNDDAGTLSAWYLFAALGIYPVAGTPDYAVTSPLFERVEIDRPEGMLVFARDAALAESDLPAVVLLGEEQAEGWVVSHRDLIASGGLRFAP